MKPFSFHTSSNVYYRCVVAAEDMYQMKKLRTELGDVHSILATIHKDLVTSASLGQYMIGGIIIMPACLMYIIYVQN